jgi:fructosamine-3-kinase
MNSGQPDIVRKKERFKEKESEYIRAICDAHGVSCMAIHENGGGYMSATYEIAGSKKRYIVKISFREDMASEIFFLHRAAGAGARVPNVIAFGLEKKIIPHDYIILEYFNGVRVNELDDDGKKYEAGTLFGSELTKLHRVRVEGFGAVDSARRFKSVGWEDLLIDRLRGQRSLVSLSASMEEELFGFEHIFKNKYAYREDPVLLHSDPGGNNFLVECNTAGEIINYRIIDPNEIVGGDPMYDLAFSQLVWNHRSFMHGVYSGYVQIHPLTETEWDRFVILKAYMHVWAALSSFAMGWIETGDDLFAEYMRIKKERPFAD